jgi:hypothetical protein
LKEYTFELFTQENVIVYQKKSKERLCMAICPQPNFNTIEINTRPFGTIYLYTSQRSYYKATARQKRKNKIKNTHTQTTKKTQTL